MELRKRIQKGSTTEKSLTKRNIAEKNTAKEKIIEHSLAERGITLVALVITIIILIILATITINFAFGEEGLIQKAQEAKNLTEGAVENEQKALNSLMDEFANIMAEEGTPPEDDNEAVDGVLAEKPQVSEGMTPVKWDSENEQWVKTTENDPEWYNYAENKKQWANVVLGDSIFDTIGGQEVLNEDEPYSMLVWIPRYAYKITSKYHQSGSDGGNIEIVFLDANNKAKDGTDYSSKTEYLGVTGEGTASGAMTDYVVHPAFDWDGKALAGFWVGKFEPSDNGGKIQIKGGVQSWRDIDVSTIHNTCIGMNNSGNSYGLNTDDSKVDPHMMKNTEWGAVAYLAQSKYGKNSEVSINSNSDFYTGGGSGTSYRTNTAQSTTGNTTGIYDMSGGAWEYVAGYVGNGGSYASSLVNAPARYKDTYSSYTAPTSGGHYGDAVWETSSSSSSSNSSWYSDYSYFPTSSNPFFVRGGVYSFGSSAGLFYFDYGTGDSFGNVSFRVVVPVL